MARKRRQSLRRGGIPVSDRVNIANPGQTTAPAQLIAHPSGRVEWVTSPEDAEWYLSHGGTLVESLDPAERLRAKDEARARDAEAIARGETSVGALDAQRGLSLGPMTYQLPSLVTKRRNRRKKG